MREIVCIVEGHGEVQAAPILIRRIAEYLGVVEPIKLFPYRGKRQKLVKSGEIERVVSLMANKVGPQGGSWSFWTPMTTVRRRWEQSFESGREPSVQIGRLRSSLPAANMRVGLWQQQRHFRVGGGFRRCSSVLILRNDTERAFLSR